jgi:hypothetical protein
MRKLLLLIGASMLQLCDLTHIANNMYQRAQNLQISNMVYDSNSASPCAYHTFKEVHCFMLSWFILADQAFTSRCCFEPVLAVELATKRYQGIRRLAMFLEVRGAAEEIHAATQRSWLRHWDEL